MTASHRLPKLRRQKEKGRPDRAFVVLDGRRVPCGRWGTDEAKRRYDRAISEWLAAGRRLPVPEKELVTVAVLVDRYWLHVQSYYLQRDGSPTDEQNNIRQALRPLTRLYPDVPVDEFTPRQLKAVRQHMIDLGWSRPWINQSIRRIRRAFRWGVEEELVPESVHRALASVAGLKAGRTEAPEPDPVKPVSDEMVETTLPHLTPTLATMVRLQRLTGMRPQDVCQMTTGDIDMSGEVWEYRPPDHKTAWRGRTRIVYIGPEAQKILAPYMKTDPAAPIFSPRQSEAERRQAMREARKTPTSCGNGPGDNRTATPRRAAADRWTTASYGRAILYACDQAFPPPPHLARQRVQARGRKRERWETKGEWRSRLQRQGVLDELEKWREEHRWSPNQLRHNYGTRVRKEHGLEAAQVLLGHAKADVTQVYAERDVERARAVASMIG